MVLSGSRSSSIRLGAAVRVSAAQFEQFSVRGGQCDTRETPSREPDLVDPLLERDRDTKTPAPPLTMAAPQE
jgi:hypothetical protein